MALKPPVEVPQGAIRLNTDSQKLEFFAQDQWWEMATTVSSGSGRGLHFAGEANSPIGYTNVINYIQISTQGDAVDFGDMTGTSYESGANSSYTRAVHTLGYNSPAYTDVIEYVTIQTAGNAIDFGNLAQAESKSCHMCDGIRDVIAAGYAPGGSYTNTIEYVTVASTGNSQDFGDVTYTGNYGAWGVNSHTRGIRAGGSAGPHGTNNNIEYITIQSAGNALDFGDTVQAHKAPAGASNSTRGLIAGGRNLPSPTPHGDNINYIDFITIATTGNSQDFGDMTVGASWPGGCSSPTRAVWLGGQTPTRTSRIDYNLFASQGDATEFGDLTHAMQSSGNASDCHGGL